MLIDPGFCQKRQPSDKSRVPPGQYETRDFPVLSLGFWEVRGYHNHGDPWTEERYSE